MGGLGGGMGGQLDHGAGMFATAAPGTGATPNVAGGSTTNPIDPYGWLLTPTALESPDTKGSSTAGNSTAHTPVTSGNGRSNPPHTNLPSGQQVSSAAATPMRHHGHSLSGSNPAHFMAASPGQFAASLAGTGNPAEGQAMFDWEGILQTIGSGWTGDGTLETGMESLFG